MSLNPATAALTAVHHPRHYTSHPSGVECITITRHMGFNLGNAVKYIWRADLKAGGSKAIEDLQKAIVYLQDEIEMRRKKVISEQIKNIGRVTL